MFRFFGKMPIECVEIFKIFKDSTNMQIAIEAGPKGWTIIWADFSTDYCDEDDTSENNFKKAYDKAVEAVGSLMELTD